MSENVAAVITAFKAPPELMRLPFPRMEESSVIVKVDAATLCGTDIGRWNGKFSQGGDDQPFLKPVQVPYIPGHETCGTVVEIKGHAVDILGNPIAVGDRLISSYSHCGHCYYCRVTRQTSFCHNVTSFGHSDPSRMIGGCAQYHYFPAGGSYVRVPKGIAPEVAASATCALRTVMHGFEQIGPVESHETVAILGAGPLGLYSLALAMERGARATLMIGAPANRLAIARDWGVDQIMNLDDTPSVTDRIAWVRDHTAGRGADVVINCASGYALVESMRMARPGGRVLQIAASGGTDIGVPPGLLFRGIRPYFPIMAEARHFYQAMEFLDSKRDRFRFASMITTRYTLEQTGTALQAMADLVDMKPAIFPN